MSFITIIGIPTILGHPVLLLWVTWTQEHSKLSERKGILAVELRTMLLTACLGHYDAKLHLVGCTATHLSNNASRKLRQLRKVLTLLTSAWKMKLAPQLIPKKLVMTWIAASLHLRAARSLTDIKFFRQKLAFHWTRCSKRTLRTEFLINEAQDKTIKP